MLEPTYMGFDLTVVVLSPSPHGSQFKKPAHISQIFASQKIPTKI